MLRIGRGLARQRVDHGVVTLVLALHGREALWVVTDRRLSYGTGRPPKDDAVKVMGLETTDGVALLAYAGLGMTPRGMQPSDWMSNVLRGRRAMTLDSRSAYLPRSRLENSLPTSAVWRRERTTSWLPPS